METDVVYCIIIIIVIKYVLVVWQYPRALCQILLDPECSGQLGNHPVLQVVLLPVESRQALQLMSMRGFLIENLASLVSEDFLMAEARLLWVS